MDPPFCGNRRGSTQLEWIKSNGAIEEETLRLKGKVENFASLQPL